MYPLCKWVIVVALKNPGLVSVGSGRRRGRVDYNARGGKCVSERVNQRIHLPFHVCAAGFRQQIHLKYSWRHHDLPL